MGHGEYLEAQVVLGRASEEAPGLDYGVWTLPGGRRGAIGGHGAEDAPSFFVAQSI